VFFICRICKLLTKENKVIKESIWYKLIFQEIEPNSNHFLLKRDLQVEIFKLKESTFTMSKAFHTYLFISNYGKLSHKSERGCERDRRRDGIEEVRGVNNNILYIRKCSLLSPPHTKHNFHTFAN
jgi:hypothetical protein